MRKAVVFAPFWGRPENIGNLRIERFIRWLSESGFYVVLVRADARSVVVEKPWGVEVSVRDPLGLYRGNASEGQSSVRKPNRLRRALAYLVLYPDPGIVLARAASKSADVLAHASGAEFILSSNPPESAHLGARALHSGSSFGTSSICGTDGSTNHCGRFYGVRGFAGMSKGDSRSGSEQLGGGDRDFKHVEKAPMQTISVVFEQGLGLDEWIPEELFHEASVDAPQPNRRFAARACREVFRLRSWAFPATLLEPLLHGVAGSLIHGTVVLAGALSERESSEVRAFAERLREYGWAICCKGWLARDEVLRLLMEADGLLLSTVTRAQIPGKLFELSRLVAPLCWSQIKTVPPGSSVKAPQAFLVEHLDKGAGQCDASSTHVLVETAQS